MLYDKLYKIAEKFKKELAVNKSSGASKNTNFQ